MALATQTRPTTGDDLGDGLDDDYLFLIGTVIVGRTSADCWICAWKEGYRQWPTSQMAVVLDFPESEYLEPCLHGPSGGHAVRRVVLLRRERAGGAPSSGRLLQLRLAGRPTPSASGRLRYGHQLRARRRQPGMSA